MGWLLCRKHPEVMKNGGKIDMADIMADPILHFQHKYYMPLSVFSCFVLPTFVPWLLWNEDLWLSYCICVFRYVFRYAWS